MILSELLKRGITHVDVCIRGNEGKVRMALEHQPIVSLLDLDHKEGRAEAGAEAQQAVDQGTCDLDANHGAGVDRDAVITASKGHLTLAEAPCLAELPFLVAIAAGNEPSPAQTPDVVLDRVELLLRYCPSLDLTASRSRRLVLRLLTEELSQVALAAGGAPTLTRALCLARDCRAAHAAPGSVARALLDAVQLGIQRMPVHALQQLLSALTPAMHEAAPHSCTAPRPCFAFKPVMDPAVQGQLAWLLEAPGCAAPGAAAPPGQGIAPDTNEGMAVQAATATLAESVLTWLMAGVREALGRAGLLSSWDGEQDVDSGSDGGEESGMEEDDLAGSADGSQSLSESVTLLASGSTTTSVTGDVASRGTDEEDSNSGSEAGTSEEEGLSSDAAVDVEEDVRGGSDTDGNGHSESRSSGEGDDEGEGKCAAYAEEAMEDVEAEEDEAAAEDVEAEEDVEPSRQQSAMVLLTTLLDALVGALPAAAARSAAAAGAEGGERTSPILKQLPQLTALLQELDMEELKYWRVLSPFLLNLLHATAALHPLRHEPLIWCSESDGPGPFAASIYDAAAVAAGTCEELLSAVLSFASEHPDLTRLLMQLLPSFAHWVTLVVADRVLAMDVALPCGNMPHTAVLRYALAWRALEALDAACDADCDSGPSHPTEAQASAAMLCKASAYYERVQGAVAQTHAALQFCEDMCDWVRAAPGSSQRGQQGPDAETVKDMLQARTDPWVADGSLPLLQAVVERRRQDVPLVGRKRKAMSSDAGDTSADHQAGDGSASQMSHEPVPAPEPEPPQPPVPPTPTPFKRLAVRLYGAYESVGKRVANAVCNGAVGL